MSFYGKIYNSIGNAFRRLKFTNENQSNKDVLKNTALSNSFMLEAQTANDHTTIGAGNRWLGMVNQDGTCLIYHLAAGTQYDSINIINDIEKNSEYDELIDFGDIITIQSPAYDEAGHLTGVVSKKYKLQEVPEVTEVIEAVESIKVINEVLGLPLGEGEELPEDTLLNRMTSTEATNADQGDRITTLENVTDVVLGLSIDKESGQITSTLVNRVEDLETSMGDLEDIGMLPDGDMSVAAILGDFTEVSGGRKSLADILGNLDHEVGENKNFAEELGTLQKTMSLVVKQLDTIDLTLESINERLTALETPDINS